MYRTRHFFSKQQSFLCRNHTSSSIIKTTSHGTYPFVIIKRTTIVATFLPHSLDHHNPRTQDNHIFVIIISSYAGALAKFLKTNGTKTLMQCLIAQGQNQFILLYHERFMEPSHFFFIFVIMIISEITKLPQQRKQRE